jgi:apolipoprotein N-acyltransferase
MEHSDAYYDNYNTALQLDNTGKIQVYHKSKLVPGVEKMPFPVLLKPLESLAINLGGTIGSLGTQQQRTPFVSPAHLKVAPIICYESVFGEHVSEFVKNGAGLLFIITNDGWWGDTPGYKQHLIYGRLRAIENRRCVVRSANTGISCFINEKGDIEDATGWWQPAVIMKTLPIHEQLTFYTRHGDYIGRISAYGTLFLILSVLLGRFSAIVFAFCSKKTR